MRYINSRFTYLLTYLSQNRHISLLFAIPSHFRTLRKLPHFLTNPSYAKRPRGLRQRREDGPVPLTDDDRSQTRRASWPWLNDAFVLATVPGPQWPADCSKLHVYNAVRQTRQVYSSAGFKTWLTRRHKQAAHRQWRSAGLSTSGWCNVRFLLQSSLVEARWRVSMSSGYGFPHRRRQTLTQTFT